MFLNTTSSVVVFKNIAGPKNSTCFTCSNKAEICRFTFPWLFDITKNSLYVNRHSEQQKEKCHLSGWTSFQIHCKNVCKLDLCGVNGCSVVYCI